jgi:hypothetical protein
LHILAREDAQARRLLDAQIPLTLPAMIDTFDLRGDVEGDDAGRKDAMTEFVEAKDVVIGRADCNAEVSMQQESLGFCNNGSRTCQYPARVVAFGNDSWR